MFYFSSSNYGQRYDGTSYRTITEMLKLRKKRVSRELTLNQVETCVMYFGLRNFNQRKIWLDRTIAIAAA